MKILFIVLTIVLSVNACNDSNNSNGGHAETPDGMITLGDTFQLHFKESIKLDPSTQISFTDLKDSRCPQGVNCIQTGKGDATLTIEKEGADPKTIILTSKGGCYTDEDGCGTLKRVAGYKVRLYNIYPYPQGSGVKDKKKSYLKLKVDR